MFQQILNLKSLLTACPERIRTWKKPKQTNPWLGQLTAGLTHSQTSTLQAYSGTDLLVQKVPQQAYFTDWT